MVRVHSRPPRHLSNRRPRLRFTASGRLNAILYREVLLKSRKLERLKRKSEINKIMIIYIETDRRMEKPKLTLESLDFGFRKECHQICFYYESSGQFVKASR